MGELHLVTGYAGQAHIKPEDDGALNRGIFGSEQYVLNNGNKLSAQVISNNKIRVLDGDILMQGRLIRLEENSYKDLTIDNGASGYNRNDLIVARYVKDTETGVETCTLEVIKGTQTTGTATDPEYTEGDLIGDHDVLNEMPLYRVPIRNLTVGTLEKIYSDVTDFSTLENQITLLNNNKLSNMPGATYKTQILYIDNNGYISHRDLNLILYKSRRIATGNAAANSVGFAILTVSDFFKNNPNKFVFVGEIQLPTSSKIALSGYNSYKSGDDLVISVTFINMENTSVSVTAYIDLIYLSFPV